jgi:uncharacterized membrane protein
MGAEPGTLAHPAKAAATRTETKHFLTAFRFIVMFFVISVLLFLNDWPFTKQKKHDAIRLTENRKTVRPHLIRDNTLIVYKISNIIINVKNMIFG